MRYFTRRADAFEASWFVVSMGIGISANLLYGFPFSSSWLQQVAFVYFALTLVSFATFHVLFVLQTARHPKWVTASLTTEKTFFLGCQPMALSTIINFASQVWGAHVHKLLLGLWTVDALISTAISWFLLYFLLTGKERPLTGINATILLSVVQLLVSSSTGATICSALPVDLQSVILALSFAQWSMGLFLAISVWVLYFMRMSVAAGVDLSLRFTTFIPLGFLGQGAFSLLLNTANLQRHIERMPTVHPTTAEPVSLAIFWLGQAMAMAIASAGLVVLVWAFCALFSKFPRSFTISWWGITFPVGTLALSTSRLGLNLDSLALRIFGATLSAFVSVVALILFLVTFWKGFIRDSLLATPVAHKLAMT